MIPFELPKLSKSDIRTTAEEFYLKHKDSADTDPIFPIEEVIEQNMRIDIVPLPGLRERYKIDAFTSSKLDNIFIDNELIFQYLGRYNFTLAHEVGHIVLHSRLFEEHCFQSVSQWANIYNGIDTKEREAMEVQANNFASFLLMPWDRVKEILQHTKDTYAELVDYLSGLGIVRNEVIDIVADKLAAYIAPIFGVSKEAAKNKIRYTHEFRQLISPRGD